MLGATKCVTLTKHGFYSTTMHSCSIWTPIAARTAAQIRLVTSPGMTAAARKHVDCSAAGHTSTC